MSHHKCEVVPVVLEKHPNADSLSIVKVFDAFTVVVRTADWVDKSLGVFIPPDSVVPDVPAYAFLEGRRRIKARKFRGIMSQGMLVPVPYEKITPRPYSIGDDCAEVLNITHYEPTMKFVYGDIETDPPFPGPKYDMESWFKYRNILSDVKLGLSVEGITFEVTITEKLHGTNARFTFQQDRMWCGSHNHYRKEKEGCLYWRALKENPWIEEYCRTNPYNILYGEIFGWVQKLHYGANPGQIFFRWFDVWNPTYGKFEDFDPGPRQREVSVPILYQGEYSHEVVEQYISGESTLVKGQMREGVVIKPTKEMWDYKLGRVVLKAVSPEYLASKDSND